MSRINTNIPALVANRVLAQQNQKLNLSLNRLSTGMRINNGKDDPAGLIASEALRAEENAIGAAIYNIGRANNVVAVAEAGLDEVSNLLTELESLIDRSSNEAGISADERNANQLQIDSILQSINRIATSTEFQGKKLLNGELDYSTSSVSTGSIAGVSVNSARIVNDGNRAVVVDVTASAQKARLNYLGTTVGVSAITLEVTGRYGTETLSFAANAAIANVVSAVNQSSDLTGVTATVASTGLLRFESTGYGTSEFVTVRTLQGTFAVTGGDAGSYTDRGRDVTATVNGASVAADGLRIFARSSTLSLDVDLTATFGTTPGSSTFYIVGGGADFQISPRVSLSGMESIGLRAVSTGNLGDSTNGALASLSSGGANQLSTGNYAVAQRVIRAAQTQISSLRGRLGAFQKDTLESTQNALRITLENTTAAESAIRDTDFAEETSNLTRSQILVQSATNTLRLANAAPQQVLALLG